MRRALERLVLTMLLGAAIAVAATANFLTRDWSPEARELFCLYSFARVFRHFDGFGIRPAWWRGYTAAEFVQAFKPAAARELASDFWRSFELAPATGAGLGLWLVVFLAGRPRGRQGFQVQRGAEVVTPRKLAKLAQREGRGELEIGGVPIPRELECLHFLVSGTTGSGKTVAITRLLDSILARGDRAIIADSGGGFLARFGLGPKDALLNPRDARCFPWSPFAEMRGEADAEILARSYCPDLPGEGKQWSGYAQTVLAEILRKLWRQGGSNHLLYQFSCLASREELEHFLAGTPAAALVGPGNAAMGANIRAMVSAALAGVRELDPQAGREAFSVRRFVREGEGWLYLPYRHEDLDVQRSFIGGLIDTGARALLSLAPDPNRRIWLVADELASLGVVSSLELVATNARKFGGALVCGLQAVSQLRERYGANRATSILSCLNTWLVLRARDAETAKAMADTLGHREVLRRTRGAQQQPGAFARGSSWAEHIATEHSVLPSELQALPALNGYLSLPGLPAAKVTLRLPPDRPAAAEAFVPRPFEAVPAPGPTANPNASAPTSIARVDGAQPDPSAPPPIEISL